MLHDFNLGKMDSDGPQIFKEDVTIQSTEQEEILGILVMSVKKVAFCPLTRGIWF